MTKIHEATSHIVKASRWIKVYDLRYAKSPTSAGSIVSAEQEQQSVIANFTSRVMHELSNKQLTTQLELQLW